MYWIGLRQVVLSDPEAGSGDVGLRVVVTIVIVETTRKDDIPKTAAVW